MQILKKKFLFKLIAALCLIITLFNVTGQNRVYAKSEYWGGVLINPVVNLLTALGDALMEIMTSSIQSQDMALIKIDGSTSWEKFWGYLATAALVLLAVCLVIAVTGGIGAGVIKAVADIVTTAGIVNMVLQTAAVAVVAGTFAGITVATAVSKGMIPEDLYLPLFSISPEEIFSNEILLFDVNFFNPMEPQSIKKIVTEQEFAEKEVDMDVKVRYYNEDGNLADTSLEGTQSGYGLDYRDKKWFQLYEEIINGFSSVFAGKWSVEELGDRLSEYSNNSTVGKNKINEIVDLANKILEVKNKTLIDKSSEQTDGYGTIEFKTFGDDGEKGVINIKITNGENENNDKAKYADVTINIIGPSKKEDVYKEVVETKYSTASQLQNIVSTWYFILRNIALLVLMLILIYTGIRIVIGSTAGEKAKYKERLMDWVVALCLVFIMHYIMVFANELVGKITDLVKKSTINGNAAYIQLTETQWDSAQEALKEFDERIVTFDDGNNAIVWTTDLAGMYRIQSQATEEGTSAWVGYSLCYCVLVLFTLFFAFTYAKRVVYMAFLTIIAPLVAMTYPLDKMTDGKAQAFDSWLKEYIFNLMIQPLHLLLYTILVSSAYALASESPIYALVAIGFMMPAEKLLRRFFGFEKAKTPGLLGGAAGAALAMTGMQNLMRKHPKGKGGSSGKNSNEEDNSKGIRFTKEDAGNPFDEAIGISGGTDSKVKQGVKTKNVSNASLEGKTDTAGAKGATITGSKAIPTNVSDKDAIQGDLRFSEKNNNSNKNRSVARAGTRAIKSYGRLLGNKALKRIENGKPIRTLARGAAGVAGSALLGAAGLTLGIASGDMNKAFQYTTAGLAGGYNLGSGIGESAINTMSVDTNEISDEALRGYYGEDYGEYKYNEARERDTVNDKNIHYVMDTLGYDRDEAKQFLEDECGEYYDKQIYDVEDWVAMHKAVESGKLSRDEATTAARLQKKLPDTDWEYLGKRKQDDYIRAFNQQFSKRFTDEDLEKRFKAKIAEMEKTGGTDSAKKFAQKYMDDDQKFKVESFRNDTTEEMTKEALGKIQTLRGIKKTNTNVK